MNDDFIVNVFVRLSVLRLMIRVKSCLHSLAKSSIRNRTDETGHNSCREEERERRQYLGQKICYLLMLPWLPFHFIEILWFSYWNSAGWAANLNSLLKTHHKFCIKNKLSFLGCSQNSMARRVCLAFWGFSKPEFLEYPLVKIHSHACRHFWYFVVNCLQFISNQFKSYLFVYSS